MTAELRPLSFSRLLAWALAERHAAASIYGVPESLFFVPPSDRRFETSRPFGAALSTPFGPAAGPHTQLAQNIVAAWLCGGRFIELKTVQVLDRLEIARPCIAAADEGYNVEWSQELTLEDSAREYAHAWALVRILPRALRWPADVDRTHFNLSVGYTLDGVRSAAVQRFLDRMRDARELLDPVRRALRADFPSLADSEIPDQVSDSVTLSTMHGCPPDEIERIARHLLEERGLHVTVKLNPTLLGPERVRTILRDGLGYEDLDVPDDAFAHDLRFDACLDLIAALDNAAARAGRRFAVKLSNTLALRNVRRTLPGDMVYMSGRALFPLTATLFSELRRAVGPTLRVSYSGGADADNAAALVAAGACPVTVATDLLKPGGFGRMRQFVDRLDGAMRAAGVGTVDAFAASSHDALDRLASDAVTSPRYRRDAVSPDLPKIPDALPAFDCIAAPCVAACPACQDVPLYASHLADGDAHAALASILARNLMPETTGHICTARCETRCTRNCIDQPVRIRDLKRFAAETGSAPLRAVPATGRRVAVIGAGPSGLAAAGFLALSGVEAIVFERRARPGGIPALAPAFRIPRDAVDRDVSRVEGLGVRIECGAAARSPVELLAEAFDAVYVACGFGDDSPMRIPGIETPGVHGALDLLERVGAGHPPALGQRVVVVGGGNTAIDAGRTALRLAATVTIVYRRTRAELPADRDEVDDFLAEGGTIVELAAPIEAISESGRLAAVDCIRNRLGEPGPDGRRQPLPIPESRFRVPADALIVAIGQAAPSFRGGDLVTRAPDGTVRVDGVGACLGLSGTFAGGDATRGPSTIIEAEADGLRAAEAICRTLGVRFEAPAAPPVRDPRQRMAQSRAARATRLPAHGPRRRSPQDRATFDLVTSTLDASAARAEAARCLQCHLLCDRCVDVCPNRANAGIAIAPLDRQVPIFDLASGAQAGTEQICIRQARQVVHLVDLCNECGNCATFCTHDGRPFAQKPRLYLSRAALEADAGPGFLLTSDELRGKDARGRAWTLAADGRSFRYVDAHLEVHLNAQLEIERALVAHPGSGTHSAAGAVEAAAILQGLETSFLAALAHDTKGDTE